MLQERVGGELVRAAASLLDEPGISILAEAEIARRTGEITALHDPTEGGFASAVRELAIVSGAGVEIEAEAIPILDETRAVAEALGIDPLGMLASGSLLIATRPEGVATIVRGMESAGIPVSVVGRLTEDPEEASLIVGGEEAAAARVRGRRGRPGALRERELPILVPCFAFMSLLLVGSVNAHVGFRDGMNILRSGGSAIDAVVAVIRKVEANPDDHSVGFGGLPNLEGEVELDASIMDGRTLATGAVAALHGYQDAIALARVVMDELPHVLVVGFGREPPGRRGRVPAPGSPDPGSARHLGITLHRSRDRGRLSGKDARACRPIEPGSGAPARRSWHRQRHRPRCRWQPRQRREHVGLGLEVSGAGR